ncbi:MAG: sn-glycerol-3-phosphate ABC transporter ATP-binding protein UgpC [Coriobacteriia bacterium]|nr:sn-glycerol-3-phosphate ABC transporter ATP-binding protein UgpC [Coriobacteriia bacterium]
MASIQLEHVTKQYPGGVTAVDDFNLSIEDREFIILVGPSGCGKSTVLRMIAGLEEITSGEIFIGDRLVNEVAPKDRDIAMVFQNYALYPHMTVYKNMAFSLKLRKTPKAEIDEKVRAAAKILDIEALLDRKPRALSGGQRQRVALGRAMVRNPSAFLLDEPLSNLDAKLRTSMRAEITKLHQQLGTTFVYVTHDQTEAMTMGDRIAVIKDGVIQQIDTPQNLYDHPANLFVGGFIGSPQMNLIDATVKKVADRFFATFGETDVLIPPQVMGADVAASYEGKSIVIGIRPEFISEGGPHSDCDTTIAGDIDLAESMGAEKFIYFVCEGYPCIAKVPGKSGIQTGDHVSLTIDCSKMHIFDKESGLAISH